MHSPVAVFVSQVVRRFLDIGAIFPTSRYAAGQVILYSDTRPLYRFILELGSGTGAVTTELMKNLHPNGILVAVDSNAQFVSFLRRLISDPRLMVFEGDALNVSSFLKKAGIVDIPDLVVSSIPLSTMRLVRRRNILHTIWGCLGPESVFIQYQYSLVSFFSLRRLFQVFNTRMVFLNFPPLFITEAKKRLLPHAGTSS